MVENSTEVIITGANGLVGLEVLKYLKGAFPTLSITAFVRNRPSTVLEGVRYVKGDLPHDVPADLFGDKKVVLLHFASLLKADTLDDYRKVNVEGTKKLLEAGGNRISRIIYGSSMSVYGQGPFKGVTEASGASPETELAISRYETEEIIRKFSKEHNVPSLLLRPRFLLGQRDKETLPALMKLQKKGLIVGSGDQQYSFIGVDDYAVIISKLALDQDIKTCEVLNIAYKETLSLKEMFSIFGEAKSYKHLPANLIMALGKFLFPLKKLRIKMQLIGQDQILDVKKLSNVYPELVSLNGKNKFQNIVKKFKEVA